MQQKLVGWVMQDEAVDIVKYMYNQEDSEELIEKMKPHFIVPAATAKKLSREEQLAQM
jgi:formate-dependent phosphoribosylglycinamide formyltransferase (GAR transformylase)